MAEKETDPEEVEHLKCALVGQLDENRNVLDMQKDLYMQRTHLKNLCLEWILAQRWQLHLCGFKRQRFFFRFSKSKK